MPEYFGQGTWLVAFLIVQRLAELVLAQRNTSRLIAQGGVEFGRPHYLLMVALHASWLAALIAAGHARPINPIWLAVFIALQAGRVWVIASLGPRWTTRIIVLPGAAPIAAGPYRFVRHPNYIIVALEIAVVPLALGLPGLAVIFSLANAAMLYVRIKVENEALIWAATSPPAALANAGPRR
ncbi:MAG: hypothetical protein JO254_09515 [Pseudolabrys sp.]|nr:hypothetical protein [Pseudolabrys sp.]